MNFVGVNKINCESYGSLNWQILNRFNYSIIFNMEHIRQFDWFASQQDYYFLNEEDLDNCVTERILRNKFRDPLISSDEDEEAPKIDWSKVFRKNHNDNNELKLAGRPFVAALRPVPPFPKLSALTPQQHMQALRVMSQKPSNRSVRPLFTDPKDLQIYLNEQKEYIEWAKTMWTNGQCARALRPKPGVENVYEAEFKMRAAALESLPKSYVMAAQISLNGNGSAEMVHEKDLINVNIDDIPQIEIPDLTKKKFTILRPCSVPEPCNKHPCRFVLPNEEQMSILPLTEIHEELARYALDNGAKFVASESALRSLVELDQCWSLPVSVCQVLGADGDKCNVVVLGSAFSPHREAAQARTYKAYRHLLAFSLIPQSELSRIAQKYTQVDNDSDVEDNSANSAAMDSAEISSDEDGDHLLIDTDWVPRSNPDTDDESVATLDTLSIVEEQITKPTTRASAVTEVAPTKPVTRNRAKSTNNETNTDNNQQENDTYYKCSCKLAVSTLERPAPRSFRRWRLRAAPAPAPAPAPALRVLVHCPHKARDETGEVVLEPIPEYQVDLGASRQTEDKLRSLALALYLRRNATLINVRVEGGTGEVVSVERAEPLAAAPAQLAALHAALAQLQGLLPAAYVLHHEPSHGANALLYAASAGAGAGAGARLQLDFRRAPAPADEAKTLRPPELAPALLPYHMHRRILPCAFTPFATQLMREPKGQKPPAKQKTPPQAIKWPKKKLRKRNYNQH